MLSVLLDDFLLNFGIDGVSQFNEDDFSLGHGDAGGSKVGIKFGQLYVINTRYK